jgi:hypothetical protein
LQQRGKGGVRESAEHKAGEKDDRLIFGKAKQVLRKEQGEKE